MSVATALREERTTRPPRSTTGTAHRSTIAERLGFCDQFHFSKQFKKEFGVSPAAYRERKRRFLADIRG